MRIALERVDTRGVVLGLPGGKDESIALVSTEHLRGELRLDGAATTLSGVRAEEVVLGAVRVLLGELVLSSTPGATLSGLGVELEQTSSSIDLDTIATTLAAEELSVEIADVSVRGRATLGGVKLTVRGDRGSLAADHVTLGPFALRIGDVELQAESVRGTRVTLAWAPDFFRLDAQSLESAALNVVTADARILASDVVLDTLAVDNANVTLGSVRAAAAHVEARMAHPSAPAVAAPTTRSAEPTGHPDAPLVDLHLLDALSGQLDVDVEVDLTVPIIGHRRATHGFRVAVDGGRIDYRALEKNLSALEDAILDFSVREGGLVLERLNPLRPTRGHGKPVVLWPLDAAGIELANEGLVRLFTLTQPELVGTDERVDPSAPAKKSPIALAHLSLRNIDARLALAPPGEAPSSTANAPRAAMQPRLRLLRLDTLSMRGNVSYDPGAPMPPGAVHGELAGLALSVHHLSLGSSTLSVGNLELASVTSLELAFVDVHPSSVRVELSGLVMTDLSVTPSAHPVTLQRDLLGEDLG